MNGTLPSCCHADYHYIQLQGLAFPIFGYVCITLCVIGSVTNLLNIIVFCKKNMVSPLNIILAGVAVSDLIVTLGYIPYSYKAHIEPLSFSITKCLNFNWIVYFLFYICLYIWFHQATIVLTVFAAVWRYIAIVYPLRSQTWCSASRTYKVVIIIFACCLLPTLMVPQTIKMSSKEVSIDENGFLSNHSRSRNATMYTYIVEVVMTESTAFNTQVLIISLIARFTPCFILIVISLRLSRALLKTKKLRRTLTNSHAAIPSAKTKDMEWQTNRTTGMLLTVLLLFLITELPEGILELLKAIFNSNFYDNCAPQFPEVYQILTLLNSVLTFPIYYVMSSKFRNTLKSVFRCGKSGLTQKRSISSNYTTFTERLQSGRKSTSAGAGS